VQTHDYKMCLLYIYIYIYIYIYTHTYIHIYSTQKFSIGVPLSQIRRLVGNTEMCRNLSTILTAFLCQNLYQILNNIPARTPQVDTADGKPNPEWLLLRAHKCEQLYLHTYMYGCMYATYDVCNLHTIMRIGDSCSQSFFFSLRVGQQRSRFRCVNKYAYILYMACMTPK
jgi:hypothetical protein